MCVLDIAGWDLVCPKPTDVCEFGLLCHKYERKLTDCLRMRLAIASRTGEEPIE